ncbi:MAG: M56 family metallopeptidase [Planctomycetes bacterium]|nr:M56 family metallopeptidase [Planctomycetota bacterium]
MIAAWWSWTIGVTLQAGVLLAIVLALDFVLRRRGWLAVRAGLWCALLLRFVLPPGLGAAWSLSTRVAERAAVDWNAVPAQTSSTALVWIFAIWAAGVVLLAIRAGRGTRTLEHLVASAEPPPRGIEQECARLARRFGLARSHEVRVSDAFGGPAVLLLRSRSVIVLPPVLLEPDASVEREHAFLHELAHLGRRDPLKARLVNALQVLFWFHPAVWIAGRRLAELRELGADARVARELRGRTSDYRASLLAAAERRFATSAPLGASAFVSGPSLLLLRLARLDRPVWRGARHERAAGAAVFAGLALFVLPMACELPGALHLDPVVAQALERWRRAEASDERQNCLEVQAAARILQAHALLTGEDLTQRVP